MWEIGSPRLRSREAATRIPGGPPFSSFGALAAGPSLLPGDDLHAFLDAATNKPSDEVLALYALHQLLTTARVHTYDSPPLRDSCFRPSTWGTLQLPEARRLIGLRGTISQQERRKVEETTGQLASPPFSSQLPVATPATGQLGPRAGTEDLATALLAAAGYIEDGRGNSLLPQRRPSHNLRGNSRSVHGSSRNRVGPQGKGRQSELAAVQEAWRRSLEGH